VIHAIDKSGGNVSGDFIGALLSRVSQRADQETVSSDTVRLSGYEFCGPVESTAEAMAGTEGTGTDRVNGRS
jgi:hypothetical protein